MKRTVFILLAALLVLSAHSALAAKAPAVELLGSDAAAAHLATHIYAYTDSWDGYSPVSCPDEGCIEYGHVHCYGRRVSCWDSPRKGRHRVPYYPGTMDTRVGPDTEFQLTDVVSFQGRYYANIRIYRDGIVINSGFISADYVGCDCASYDAREEVYEYDHQFGPFDLR